MVEEIRMVAIYRTLVAVEKSHKSPEALTSGHQAKMSTLIIVSPFLIEFGYLNGPCVAIQALWCKCSDEGFEPSVYRRMPIVDEI